MAHKHATNLLSKGFAVIPVPPKSKAAVLTSWPSLRVKLDQVDAYFPTGKENVGILWGAPSGGRVDVDIDHPAAVNLADGVLPPTECEFGRPGKVRSHRLYMPTGGIKSEVFRAERIVVTEEGRQKVETEMIIEIRADGLSTIGPGSVHPSGETVQWYAEGDAAKVDPQELRAAVRSLAEAVFVAEFSTGGWTRSWDKPSQGTNRTQTWTSATVDDPTDRLLQRLRALGFQPKESARGWVCKCPGHDDRSPSLSIARGDSGNALLHCFSGCDASHIVAQLGLTMKDLMPSSPKANPSVSSVGAVSGGSPDSQWVKPKPLPNQLVPVLPFDPNLLPASVRPIVCDIADRIQCPIDFVAVAQMVALSSLIGRKLGIRPKCYDNWTVVPNLWGAVVGRPGIMKTPAIQEPLKPLQRFEAQAKKEYDEACKLAEVDDIVADAKRKAVSQEIKKKLKNPEDAKRLAMESIAAENTDKPVRKRYIVNDSTVEKLGEILNQNKFGVLVYRDELIGLLKSLDKDGQEGARSFYLEAWNGTGPYCYDRIGRGTLDIEAAIVSILGGIQPGPITQYLLGAIREGKADDGLMQRFQLLVWPDVSNEWKNVDRPPDAAARALALQVYEGLDQLDPEIIGAEHDPHDEAAIPYLRFANDAQGVFDDYRTGLERILRSGELPPVLESHLSKYRSLVPSLALIIHVAEGMHGPVSKSALERAIALASYLRSHAERVYSSVVRPDVVAAKLLSGRIQKGDLESRFTARSVYRHDWSGLTMPDVVQKGLELLEELGWVRSREVMTGGRSSVEYDINPLIQINKEAKNEQPPPKGTDKADKSPPSTTSGGSVGGNQEPSSDSPSDDDWGRP